MPRIQPYEVHTYGAEPRGGVPADLRANEMLGRGAENLGESVSDAGQRIIESSARSEVAHASLLASQAELDGWNQINKGAQSGVFDTTKFLNGFDDQVSNQSDQFTTAFGRDEYTSQMARVKESLGRTAIGVQSQIAEQNTLTNLTQSVSNDSISLQNDPTLFPSIINRQNAAIDSYVKNGTLNFAKAADEKRRIGSTLSQAALLGHMSVQFDNEVGKAQSMLDQGGVSAIPQVEKYRASLDNEGFASKMMGTGVFDQYLAPNEKTEIFNKERQYRDTVQSEIQRRIALTNQAHDQVQKNWLNENSDKIIGGKMPMKDILSSPLDLDKKMYALKAAANATKYQEENPAATNDITRRILEPDSSPDKINDPFQIYSQIGSTITAPAAQRLVKLMDETPEGKAHSFNRRQVFNVAKSSLVKNGFMGATDPNGEFHLTQFMQDLQSEEEKYREQGKDVNELYNTRSKNYFASQENLSKYQSSPSEILQNMAGGNQPVWNAYGQAFQGQKPNAPAQIAPQATPHGAPEATSTPKKILGFDEWIQTQGKAK